MGYNELYSVYVPSAGASERYVYSTWRQCQSVSVQCRRLLKCDGVRAETRFCLSAKRTSPFKSVGASVQSTTGSRGVRISGSNAGYTVLRGSVKDTGYPLHSPVLPSLPLPCVTVCHHVSTGLYITDSVSRCRLNIQYITTVSFGAS